MDVSTPVALGAAALVTAIVALIIVWVCTRTGGGSVYHQRGFMRMRRGGRRRPTRYHGYSRGFFRPWLWDYYPRYYAPLRDDIYYGDDGYWRGYGGRDWICTRYGCERVAPGTGVYSSRSACNYHCPVWA